MSKSEVDSKPSVAVSSDDAVKGLVPAPLLLALNLGLSLNTPLAVKLCVTGKILDLLIGSDGVNGEENERFTVHGNVSLPWKRLDGENTPVKVICSVTLKNLSVAFNAAEFESALDSDIL
jgi:hypothetical protein